MVKKAGAIQEVTTGGGDPVLVIDVSRWQAEDPLEFKNPRQMDWEKALEAGVDGAMIRCGIGYIQDWTYEHNRAECERLKIPFGVYHAFIPSGSIEKQVKFFTDRMAGQIYPAADLEVNGGYSKTELSKRCREYMIGIEATREPMIYTRATWWNENIGMTWGKDYPLWAAHYGAKAPALPVGWKTWKFWQYSADGNGKGAEYGARSNSIDLNRYNGTKEEYVKEFEIEQVEPEPEPVPEPVPVAGLKFRVAVPKLNIRTGPGTQYRDIGDLAGNQVVTALNVNGSDAWIEIEPGKWACVQKGNTQYMTLVTEE